MADVFDEAEDTFGLDIAEQVEANGGEYEVIPDEAPNVPGGDGHSSESTQDFEPPTGTTRPRNPDGTFAPRRGDQQQADPAQADEARRVPISAIQEERRKRQELERRLNERDREWAVIQERVRIFQEQQQAEQARRAAREQAALQAQRDPEPDPDADPLGHAQWMIRKQQERMQNLEAWAMQNTQRLQQEQSQAVAQQTVAQIGQQVQNMQMQFTMQHPDYPDAFAHLAQTRFNELRLMGYSDDMIPQILEQEKTMIVTGCMQRRPDGGIDWKDNPARVAYALAHQRGYAGPQPQQVAQPQQMAPQQMAPQSPNAQRVQQMQQRVDRTQVPQGVQPSAPGTISMETLPRMDEHEFEALMTQDPHFVDALMGAR